MSSLESLYQKLPVGLQSLACSLEGWRIERNRYGGRYSNLLREVESRTYWSRDEVFEWRDRRLSAFIQYSYSTVPFYQRKFKEWGISSEDIRTIEDLSRLPFLSKSEVQENYLNLMSRTVPKEQQIIGHTSGTTGGGLRFATTLEAMQEQWAVWWRYRGWHDLTRDIWCGYFGGRSVVPLTQKRPPFWRVNIPGRQIMFSAYHINHDNLRSYIDELRRKRPPWLHGYPSLLALVASYILDTGSDLGYQIRWITTGAENLLPQQISLIERAFGVSPRQHYGMAEAVANLSECENGALHVDEDFSAVEFVPNGDGVSYKVIGTNFTNLATPLLRYDVGDTVTLIDTTCQCGRPGRIVANVDGRLEDYVILRNGAKLGRLDHIFKDLTNIRESQICQKQAGEVAIRVVPGDRYSASDETVLLREARQRLGDETTIHIEYTTNLQRSSTGKLRFVISDVPEGKLKK